MLSRSAQGLYWIGRYLERAQHGCRLLTDQFETLKDRSVEEIELSWRRLYAAVDRVPLGGGLGSNLGDDQFMLVDAFTLAHDLTFESNNPDAIRSCLGTARENARQVRNTINDELWACLNVPFLEMRGVGIEDIWKDHPGEFYLSTEKAIETFSGHRGQHHVPRRTLALPAARSFCRTDAAPRRADRCAAGLLSLQRTASRIRLTLPASHLRSARSLWPFVFPRDPAGHCDPFSCHRSVALPFGPFWPGDDLEGPRCDFRGSTACRRGGAPGWTDGE